MPPTQAETWTVLRMLEWGTGWFTEKQVDSPRLSIEWLVADALKTRRLNLYVQFDRPLSSEELTLIRSHVKRRARHEPLQYITGSTTFYNAEIGVEPGVLIPRPETEELVELVLQRHGNTPLRVLDVGTGSGCIPIALSLERPEWDIHAVDLSEDALRIARKNVDSNKVDVTLALADLFDLKRYAEGPWDIILSNPPYIHHDEAADLHPQVRAFEPSSALFCENRVSVYEHLIRYAASTLSTGGRLYVELHLEHEIENDPCIRETGVKVIIHNDLSGRRRFAEFFFASDYIEVPREDGP